jgi:Family of unknown function (DUF5989)
MSLFGELQDYIREYKRYWLLPVLIPILIVHGLIVGFKSVIRALQSLGSAAPALSRKLHGGFVTAWARLPLRHSRRA